MSKQDAVSPKRGRWLRRLAWIAGAFVLLVLVGYFVITSGAFFKAVILPRVGAAMNATVTVSDAAISPFSQVELRDLKVTPHGADTLLTVGQIRLRYHLMSILGGRIAVDEILVDSPSVNLVQNADGTSNLDPILKSSPPAASSAPSQTAPAKTLVLDIKSVTIKNASVRQVTHLKTGGQQTVSVANGTFTLADLSNSGTAKLDLGADLSVDASAPKVAALAAKLIGHLAVSLGADATPSALNGALTLAVQQASGAAADLADFSATLQSDITATAVKELALKFRRGAADLGQVRLSGPFDLAKHEGTLALEISGIDRQVLNLAGRSQALDFGATRFSSTNQIQLTAGGRNLALSGQLLGQSVGVSQAGLTTPPLDLALGYQVAVDQAQQNAWLRSFRLDASHNHQPLLLGALTKPMKFDWRPGASPVEESDLTLTLANFNLGDYRALIGTNVLGGTLQAVLGLQCKAAGRQTFINLEASGADLAAAAGTNVFSGLGFHFQSSSTLNDFEKLQIQHAAFQLTHNTRPLAGVQVSGNAELSKQNVTLAVNGSVELPELEALAPTPGTTLASGTLRFDKSIKQENTTLPGSKTPSFTRAVDGNLNLVNLTGTISGSRLDNFESAMSFDLGMQGTRTTVRKFTGSFKQACQPAGGFSATAENDLATQATKFTLQLADLNQNLLRPFLASALGDKSLTSVSINADLAGGFDPAGESTVRGNLAVTNLVVKDPSGALPATPLAAGLRLDAGVRKQIVELRDCTLTLTPTARGKNAVTLTGTVDRTRTNAISGALKLAADSIDATDYYNTFTGGKKPATAGAPAPAPASTAGLDQEPAPIALPFTNFTFDAAIGRFVLREVDITKFHALLRLDGSRVTLNPFQFALNGAPLQADASADLGVPGYTYALNLAAPAIPLPPLVDSFLPDRQGQFSGTATANAKITGAGVTGASLQKHLAGTFDLSATNLNFSLPNARMPMVRALVNVLAGVPDLIRNPTAAVGNLLSQLTGAPSSGGAGGWADQLLQSPLNSVIVRGSAGAGQVQLQEATLQTGAFIAQAAGSVGLAPVLTNSTLQIPVHVSLSRGLADKVRLVPAGTPTNAVFVKLPDFVTMKGTVGAPKPDINYLALTSLALQGGGGILGNTGGAVVNDAKGVVGAVTGLLGGGTPAATNPPAASGGGLGGILGGLLGGGAPPATNAPTPKATNPPPASPVNDLLNLFGRPRK